MARLEDPSPPAVRPLLLLRPAPPCGARSTLGFAVLAAGLVLGACGSDDARAPLTFAEAPGYDAPGGVPSAAGLAPDPDAAPAGGAAADPAAALLRALQQAVRADDAAAFAAAFRFPLADGTDRAFVQTELFPLLSEPGRLRERFLRATERDLAGEPGQPRTLAIDLDTTGAGDAGYEFSLRLTMAPEGGAYVVTEAAMAG